MYKVYRELRCEQFAKWIVFIAHVCRQFQRGEEDGGSEMKNSGEWRSKMEAGSLELFGLEPRRANSTQGFSEFINLHFASPGGVLLRRTYAHRYDCNWQPIWRWRWLSQERGKIALWDSEGNLSMHKGRLFANESDEF